MFQNLFLMSIILFFIIFFFNFKLHSEKIIYILD